MKNKIKLITWFTALAVGLSLTTAAGAKERGNRGHNNGGAQVIVNGPDYVYYEPRYRSNRAQAYQQRGNRHAYSRPYYSRADYKRMKKRQKMRKMRQMRRAYQDHYYDRPVIVIPFPHFIR
tara:strand:- start:75553 stop:75915 length:363 start_codon:yes stop_codon:yes gene_type:complete